MLPFSAAKYTGFRDVYSPNRQWPNKVIRKAPIWLSTDLRDENQSLESPLTLEQKWDFFKTLVDIGFKEIEVSFPAASNVEFDFARRLVETPGIVPHDVRLRALAPTREDFLRRTVNALQGARKATVGTYICVSDKQLKYQGFSREKAIDQAVKAVRFVRSITTDDPESKSRTEWSLGFGLESYNESDQSFSIAMANAVILAWGPSVEEPLHLVLTTSTEVTTPNLFADQVETFIRALSTLAEKVILSIHCHNDRGTGVASAELGMLAGAQMVEGCLLGNGERAGNVDLVTLALNLYSRGIHPKLDLSNLYAIKRKYENITGLNVGPRVPYAGDYALQAFSGHHQNIIRKGMLSRMAVEGHQAPMWDIPYLPLDPEDLGIPLDYIIRVNSQSGKAAAAWILHRRWGLELPADMEVDFGSRLMAVCEALAREITQMELVELFISTYALTVDQSKTMGNSTPQRHSGGHNSDARVKGVITPAKGVAYMVEGTAKDFEMAALQSLNFQLEGNAVVIRIHSTQQLNTELGMGWYCALTTYKVGDQVPWGYSIHKDKAIAEALGLIAATLCVYYKAIGLLDIGQAKSIVGEVINLSAFGQ